MAVDLETYRLKAQLAIETVFRSEYHNSLGIPMPKVKMLLSDDDNYSTGEYYIQIDQTWQIHLNFGKCPISFKEFEDEVKVLTRHEVEHYMCCPFDIITHFRMLKRIYDVYLKDFSHLNIDIDSVCGSISNQAADIIVDTKNYLRHPDETLKSEIEWIKKGAKWTMCQRHNKLMFLTKEALWGKSLELNETDSELINMANTIANRFKRNGIEDKASFLDKTEEYASAFFRLYIKDQEEQGKQIQTSPQGGRQGYQQNGHQQGFSQSGQGQGSQQDSQQQNSPQTEQQQTNNPSHHAGRPKDGSDNGSAFVFADPDKVKEAIEAFAQEAGVQEFSNIMTAAGITNLNEKQKYKLWFTVHTSGMIPIEEFTNSGNKATYSYPSLWKLGDPIDDIDMMLSLMTSPRIIPGITTKKWETIASDVNGIEQRQRDLLLVLDTSGSMGSVLNENSNMHQAILAAFGIVSYFESTQSQVALIEFNDRVTKKINWTKKYDEIRDNLLVNGSGSTNFPIKVIKDVLEESNRDLVTVLITDGELGNAQESVNYFKEYLIDDNKLYIFILGTNHKFPIFEKLKDIGAHTFQSNDAKSFCNMVINDL